MCRLRAFWRRSPFTCRDDRTPAPPAGPPRPSNRAREAPRRPGNRAKWTPGRYRWTGTRLPDPTGGLGASCVAEPPLPGRPGVDPTARDHRPPPRAPIVPGMPHTGGPLRDDLDNGARIPDVPGALPCSRPAWRYADPILRPCAVDLGDAGLKRPLLRPASPEINAGRADIPEINAGEGAPARRPPRARPTTRPLHRATHPDHEEPATRQAGPGRRPACTVVARRTDHAHARHPTALQEGPPTFPRRRPPPSHPGGPPPGRSPRAGHQPSRRPPRTARGPPPRQRGPGTAPRLRPGSGHQPRGPGR